MDIERGWLGLTELREDSGLSKSDLAGILDVTVKTVSNWEQNGLPGIKHYQKIIKLFDLDNDTFQSLR